MYQHHSNIDQEAAIEARRQLAQLVPLPADASDLARCQRAVLVTKLLQRAGVRAENPDGEG